jgi:hypothetical protein
VDIVFGVSMAPSTVRMVLVDGENGDGATLDRDAFPVTTAAATGNAATSSATDQVLAAILGTRQGAAESGYRLASTGVTWVDPVEAGVLRDALAAHRVENIMLVSAFLAAAALAQAYGTCIGYAHTGLLFIEPDCAPLAVVDSGDGSITDVRRASLPNDDADAVAELTAMAAGASRLEPHPQGLFVVGSSGVDVALTVSGARRRDSADRQRAHRAGIGAGSRCGPGIRACAAFRLVNLRLGVCPRSRHRSGGAGHACLRRRGQPTTRVQR